jgi:hypothetical protein
VKKSKELTELAMEKVCSNVNAINAYWAKSREMTSVGWDGAKINDDDLIVEFSVTVMDTKFCFRALHTFNRDRFEWNGEPELVKVEVE